MEVAWVVSSKWVEIHLEMMTCLKCLLKEELVDLQVKEWVDFKISLAQLKEEVSQISASLVKVETDLSLDNSTSNNKRDNDL